MEWRPAPKTCQGVLGEGLITPRQVNFEDRIEVCHLEKAVDNLWEHDDGEGSAGAFDAVVEVDQGANPRQPANRS